MTIVRSHVLEGFAQKMLAAHATVTVPSADLAAQGYDVALLTELIAEYLRLPDSERNFDFMQDFGRLDRGGDFVLHIQRL